MRSRLPSFAALLAVLVALNSCNREDSSGPINVLLISIDTLRADRLNCYGYEGHQLTPNLDALAADGLLFENYISASPWTTPSHMSLITSMYPSTHGLLMSFQDLVNRSGGDLFNRLPDARHTLAEALRDNGYATAAFTGGITVEPTFGFDQGFGHYETSMYKLNRNNVDNMTAWIDRQEDQPWFLFFHTFETHAPYLHTDLLGEEYAEAEKAYRARTDGMAEATSLADHMSEGSMLMHFLRQQGVLQPEFCERLYLGGIKAMDGWIGQIVAKLREQGQYDNTMIIFTSDHGEEFADHDARYFYDAHGHTAFEEVLRIPLIVKLPHQAHAGTRLPAVARTIDVMPTVLDLLDISLPLDEMQGDSLSPWWRSPGTVVDDRIAFSEASARAPEIKSLRTNRHKYVVTIGGDKVARHGRGTIPEQLLDRELFDLQTDPGEQHNLLDGTPSAAVLELAAVFDARLRAFAAGQQGHVELVELDPETIKQLKALGYLE